MPRRVTLTALVAAATLAALPATPEANRRYTYHPYAGTKDMILSLQSNYPHLVRVNDAQTEWNVASPGRCGNEECRQYYAVITKLSTLDDDPDRPEVFFSGSVHGNERIGPTTTVEFARLLCENYDQGNNTWLRRLVETRSIWIMPNANALGYYQNVREENHVDPNRDFPYGQMPRAGAPSCMQTTAARALNELYREHAFQLALTFHGGMCAIAYEWGSPNHPRYRDVSPDDGAFRPLGNLMRTYASRDYYPVGRMNSIVYPVTGGMEDWAYAASWDTDYTPKCSPQTYGGYPVRKTTYTEDQLRVFNILIETSRAKEPTAATLGWTDDLLQYVGSQSDGHIPRNIRLCLAMTDLVQPYVVWMMSETEEVPALARDTVAIAGETVTFSWDVGGAITVDTTRLVVLPIAAGMACPTSAFPDTGTLGNATEIDAAEMIPGSLGTTTWTSLLSETEAEGQSPDALDHSWVPYRQRYSATHTFEAPARYVVRAYAKVDQNWGHADGGHPSAMRPQAHVVRARTIDGYSAENNGHRVVGRLKWFARPRCFTVLGPATDATTTNQPTTTAPEPESSTESLAGLSTESSTEPSTTAVPTVTPAAITTTEPTTSADSATTMPGNSSTVPVVTTTEPTATESATTESGKFSTVPVAVVTASEPGTSTLSLTDPPMDAALRVIYSGDYAELAALDDGVRHFGDACMAQLRLLLPRGVPEHSSLHVSAGSVVLEVTFAGVPGGANAAASWLPRLADKIVEDPLSVVLGGLYFQSTLFEFKTNVDGIWSHRSMTTTAAPRTSAGATPGVPNSSAAGPDPDMTGVTTAIAGVSVALLLGLGLVAYRMRCRTGTYGNSFYSLHHNDFDDNHARGNVYLDHATESFMMQTQNEDSDD